MQATTEKPPTEIVYPETDGQPMANNTTQANVMTLLKDNLEAMFADREDVFVAMDLFWYPVEGRPDIRTAPDVMVVLGRPKGHRGSYKQWEEGNIAPQVVFEVVSPGNTLADWGFKYAFYDRFGVQEYYIYDPDTGQWYGALRKGELLEPIENMEGWVSPLLGIRFERGQDDDPGVYDSEGNRFVRFEEVKAALRAAIARAEQERQRAERLAQRLRELGVEENGDE
ncbi:MAG: Uma2 family endonuclease [Fimbriimonadales bacterium]|nr:Uma2 family endonuclease [Fimbriimonadales bacterium]